MLMKPVTTWEGLLEVEGCLSPPPRPELPSQCAKNRLKELGNTDVSVSEWLGKSWSCRLPPCLWPLTALSSCLSVLCKPEHLPNVPWWENLERTSLSCPPETGMANPALHSLCPCHELGFGQWTQISLYNSTCISPPPQFLWLKSWYYIQLPRPRPRQWGR